MTDYDLSHIERCIRLRGQYSTDVLGRKERAFLKLHPECSVKTIEHPAEGGQPIKRFGKVIGWGGVSKPFKSYIIHAG